MLARRAILAAPLALAACNGMPPSQSIQTVAQDVQIIATGLGKTLTQLSALNLPGLTPAILDMAQTALAGLQTVSQAFAGVSTATDAQPLVIKVESYVNAFVGALSILPLPPEIKTGLLAAQILLPVIEMAVNLAVPPKTVATTMTADQARAALK